MLDNQKIRSHFPFFKHTELVYLDNGATTQKPQNVIDAITDFYTYHNANVHRGVSEFASNTTALYEQARTKLAHYCQVKAEQIVWTKGATEAINLVASSIDAHIEKDDVIIISALEHHANIVPWQTLCKRTGAKLHILPVDANGVLNLDVSLAMINTLKPKLMAISHASNTLGNILPIQDLLDAAHAINAITLVDGAQAMQHLRPNISALSCDFYVLSAHKMFGPTGVGALIAKPHSLSLLSTYQTGGEMIERVSFNETSFRHGNARFEAGTPNIAGVIGFAAALDFMGSSEMATQLAVEKALYQYTLNALKQIDGIKIYGDLNNNIGTISFNYKDEHNLDVATLLDQAGIIVRSGNHCTQPLINLLGVAGTIRVSLSCYNSFDDIDRFIVALKQAIELLD
ncbi:aminotransferase class V-fold PLP-dependent enzyme [Pseudoalteromonas spongiae]|uniref:aminotransferase class V-fold PLP-dependent enzyme n=1 Tax=Pseudoalteromonas spongiae TaxID=298657 RepID=UPI00026CDA56|nr:cysteine desulfurase [Pseudoalteromonas spongiae]ATC98757.1 cysteine desulfurase / selenocysteine lyase [Pseudoalteromonas spongiae UST010723-006]